MIRTRIMAASGLLVLAASGACAQAPTPGTPTSAATLAANCANCHGTTGNAKGGMPSLAGQKKDYIVEQIKAFRDGKRPSTIMQQLAKGYTDEQIDLVADFFARQTPAR